MNLKNSIQLQWKKSIKLWWLMVMGGIFTFENHRQNFNGHFQKNYSSKKRLLKVGLGLLALNKNLANGQYSPLEQYNFTTNFNEDSVNQDDFVFKNSISYSFYFRNEDGTNCIINEDTAPINLNLIDSTGSACTLLGDLSCAYNTNINDPDYGKLCHPSNLKSSDICNINNCIIKTPLSFNKDARCGSMMPLNTGSTLVSGSNGSKARGTFTISSLSTRVTGSTGQVRFLKSLDLKSGEITELTTLTATAPANKAVTIQGVNINPNSPYFGDFCYVNNETPSDQINLYSSINPLSLKTVSTITSKGLSLISGDVSTPIFSVYIPKLYPKDYYNYIESPYSANHNYLMGVIGKEKAFTRMFQGMTKASRLEYFSLQNGTSNPYSVFWTDGIGYDNGFDIMGNNNNITFDSEKGLSFSHDYPLPSISNQLHRNFELTNIMDSAFVDGFQLIYNKDTKNSSLTSFFDNNQNVKISVKDHGHVLVSNSKLNIKQNDGTSFNSVSMKMFKKLLSATKITSLVNGQIVNPNINEADLNLMTSFLKEVFKNNFSSILISNSFGLSMEVISQYDWNKIFDDFNEEVKNDSNAIKSAKIFNFFFPELNYNDFLALDSTDIVRTKFLSHQVKREKSTIQSVVRLLGMLLNKDIILIYSSSYYYNYDDYRDFTNSFLKEAFETDTTKAETKSEIQNDKYFKSLSNDVLYKKYIAPNIKSNDYLLPMSVFIQDLMLEFNNFLSVNFGYSTRIDDRILQNFLMENLFNRFRDASCKTNLLIVNDLNRDIYNVPSSMNVFKLKSDTTIKNNPNKYYSGSVKKDLMKLANDYANNGKLTNPSFNLFEDVKQGLDNIFNALLMMQFESKDENILNGLFINSILKGVQFVEGHSNLNTNQLENNYVIVKEPSIWDKEFIKSNKPYDINLRNNIEKINNIFSFLLNENCNGEVNGFAKTINFFYQQEQLFCNLNKYEGKNEEFRLFIFDIFKTLEDIINESFPGQEELRFSQEFIYDLIENVKNLQSDEVEISDLYDKLKLLNPLMTHLHLPFQNNRHWLSHIEEIQLWYNYLMEYHNDDKTVAHYRNHDVIKDFLSSNTNNPIIKMYDDDLVESYSFLIDNLLSNNNDMLNLILSKNTLLFESDLININNWLEVISQDGVIEKFNFEGLYNEEKAIAKRLLFINLKSIVDIPKKAFIGLMRLIIKITNKGKEFADWISEQTKDERNDIAVWIENNKPAVRKFVTQLLRTFAKSLFLPEYFVDKYISESEVDWIINKLSDRFLKTKTIESELISLPSNTRRILEEKSNQVRTKIVNDLDSLNYCKEQYNNRLVKAEDLHTMNNFYLCLLIFGVIAGAQSFGSIMRQVILNIVNSQPNSKISKKILEYGFYPSLTMEGKIQRIIRHYQRFSNTIALSLLASNIALNTMINKLNHCVKNGPTDSAIPKVLLVLISISLFNKLGRDAYAKMLNDKNIQMSLLTLDSLLEVAKLTLSIMGLTEF
jgi:hypothetical protein